ncbi:MAG: hypothetical protein Q8M95_09495, partial [Candidatus Methanoperedens sp.]|nr:hypothetical protein [Candidatus Methanoperedens sp.]
MNKESNIFKNIITVLLALLVFGMLAGTASAAITSITVTAPNGGETWSGSKDITWTPTGNTDTVNIYYSTNNFASSILIVSGTLNDGIH